jgi:Mn-containing catalase
MRYFSQGWAESDVPRRDMLLDIATEELSHHRATQGSRASLVDELESGYLSDVIEGKQEQYQQLSWNSGGS